MWIHAFKNTTTKFKITIYAILQKIQNFDLTRLILLFAMLKLKETVHHFIKQTLLLNMSYLFCIILIVISHIFLEIKGTTDTRRTALYLDRFPNSETYAQLRLKYMTNLMISTFQFSIFHL